MVVPLIAGAVAVLGVAGGAFALGEINTLINTIFANSSTILFAGVIVTGLYIAVQSATENDNKIIDDIGVFALVIGVMLGWFFLVPTVSGQIYGWDTTMEVNVHNPALDEPYIASVNAVDVQKSQQLSLFPELPGINEETFGTVTVDCGQGERSQSYGMTLTETQTTSKEVSVNGVPGNQGTNCDVSVTLENQEKQLDTFESQFTLSATS